MQTMTDRQVLQGLEASKQRWARLPVRDKVAYLREVRRLTVRHAAGWAEAGSRLRVFPLIPRWG